MRRRSMRSSWDSLMGMNARNALISAKNDPKAMQLVNRKLETKRALAADGIATAPTIGTARHERELRPLADRLPRSWALKPNRGYGGMGIMLATDRTDDAWQRPGGGTLGHHEVLRHGRRVLDGEYSMGEGVDAVLVEPLLRAHPVLRDVAPAGLPDIRVIALDGEPLAAMLRLPTSASGGKANLHQGGIGVGLDLRTGRSTHAVMDGRQVDRHPDSGRSLELALPHWDDVLEMAARAGDALGLGYYGIDVVIDADRGALTIEVNARPGLQVQNVAGVGLRRQMMKVQNA